MKCTLWVYYITSRGVGVSKAECPFKELHESQSDNNPSLTVNLQKGVYYCNSCHSKGNIHTMYRYLEHKTAEEALVWPWWCLKIPFVPMGTKPASSTLNLVWFKNIIKALMSLTGSLRDVLRDRLGLVDDTLISLWLGWWKGYNTCLWWVQWLVNFRRYKWNSDNDQYKVLTIKMNMVIPMVKSEYSA